MITKVPETQPFVRRCDSADDDEAKRLADEAEAERVRAEAAAAAPRTDAGAAGAAAEVWVNRSDRGSLIASRTTPEGFILCEGYVAKPGVLRYQNVDGTVTRELVLPEELHREDSLGTLGRKPVTLEHPPEDVTKDNVGKYGVGDLDGEVVIEPPEQGGFVKVKMAVRRVDAVHAMTQGIRELSPGYKCRIDQTPGTHPIYGEYDAIQRDRRYNHTAITRAARGGPKIAARVDSAFQIDPPIGASMNPKILALLAALKLDVAKVTGNRTDDAASDAAIDAAIVAANAMGTQLAEVLPQAATAEELRGQITALTGQLAALQAKLTAAEASVAAKVEPDVPEMIDLAMDTDMPAPIVEGAGTPATPTPEQKKMDAIRTRTVAAITERGRLETMARGLRIDAATMSHLGNKSLRKLIVTTANKTARSDASDDYYKAACDMMGRTDSERPNPYQGLGTGEVVVEERRSDAMDDGDPALASLQAMQSAHKRHFDSTIPRA